MRGAILLAAVLVCYVSFAVCACAAAFDAESPPSASELGTSRIRIGSSHVVDSRGDVWLVGGLDSDHRGPLVVGECASESGWCSDVRP